MNGNKSHLGISTGLVAGFALLCSPSRAAAHLVTTGMGPVYDGIAHLLLTPEDLVPVLAIALYAGLRGRCREKDDVPLPLPARRRTCRIR
jgi:hydrogenase/urease accessory protein HupE